MSLREIWQRLTTTRYARALEAELARERAETDRLRAENRALLNSILGIAGIPPLPAPRPGDDSGDGALYTAPLADVRERPRPAPHTSPAPRRLGGRSLSSDNSALHFGGALAPEVPANGAKPFGAARLAAPTRRRSWQQINRLLELESARKQNSP